MKDTKQKADDLVEKHHKAHLFIGKIEATHHAILSTENTIKVLEKVSKGVDDWDNHLKGIIDEQTEILKELEGRI